VTASRSIAAETLSVRAPILTRSVTSADGTLIGYRELGAGPGLVILHGTAQSSMSHIDLALHLSTSHTVYLPDRRGRGLSGPFRSPYSPMQEVEDLRAVLAATGAHKVFAMSAGAIVALEAARLDRDIHLLAVFEPPYLLSQPLPTDTLKRFDDELARGNVAGALVASMKAARMGPAFLRALPYWLLEPVVRTAMHHQDKKGTPGDVTLRALAPTLHYDFELATTFRGALERLRGISSKMLLLSGTRSPMYLRNSVDELARVLPRATRVSLKGLGHEAACNSHERGSPALVAEVLERFFQEI
jgi:pimeloyl-ACP methyl ester carboxylesterase